MFITPVSFSQNKFNVSSKNRFAADKDNTQGTPQDGESIKVGDGITIVVVTTRGDKVKLGVEAPRDTPVVKPPKNTKPNTPLPKSRFDSPGSSSNN